MERSTDDDINRSIPKYSLNRPCSCYRRSKLNVHTFLAVSFLFNIIFVVLFVLVFLRLDNVQTRVAKLESPAVIVDRSRPHSKEGIVMLPKTNSTLGASAVNVTRRPVLIQSMPSLHISKRSTSHTQPTQPSKEKKKVPKHIRDYVKRQFRKSFEVHRQGLLNELRGRKTPGQDCPTSCKGAKGDPGTRGRKGVRGDRGPRGDDGQPGHPGMAGRQGIPGIQGPKGYKGEMGAKGEQGKGIRGETGIQGLPGKRGPAGKKGDPGSSGEKGERGPKGEKGDVGSLETAQRPSAHLTGHSRNAQNSPRSGILRHWDNNLGFAHSSGGMQYRNGELIIPLSGRYYIYSQLYFQDEDDRAHLVHFVHLSRNGTQTIIMRSVSSRCRAKKSRTFLYSSYQGGVFDLLNGDHILVGVSEDNTGSVSTGESASFFGAFLV